MCARLSCYDLAGIIKPTTMLVNRPICYKTGHNHTKTTQSDLIYR